MTSHKTDRSQCETESSNHMEDQDQGVVEDEVDLSCGVGRFRTHALGTCFSNLYVFSVLAGISGMFGVMSTRIVSVQLESLERQFNIDNSQAGLFETSAKIGLLSTVLFAGHFTRKYHIPVTIAVAGIIQGLALMAPALLQFADPYTLTELENTSGSGESDNSQYLCDVSFDINNKTSQYNQSGQTNTLAFAVLLSTLTVKGVTDSFHAYFLPTVYMDDNMLDKTRTAFFLGIRFFINGLSGPIGTEISGLTTRIPIDLKDTEMDPKDGRFIAAWWLPFLLFGAGTILSSIPLLLFPRTLVSRSQKEKALKMAAVVFIQPNAERQTDDLQGAQVINTSFQESAIVAEVSNQLQVKVNGDDVIILDEMTRKICLNKDVEIVNKDVEIVNKDVEIVNKDVEIVNKDVESVNKDVESVNKDVEIVNRDVEIVNRDVEFDPALESYERGEQTIKELIKDIPKSLYRLLKSPVFVLGLIDISVVSIPVSGMFMFRSIYMTMEYNVPMDEVSLASSVTSAVGSLSGTLLSSWVTSKVKSKLGLQYLIMGSYLLQVVFNPLFLIFGCDNRPVYGFTGKFGIPVNSTSDCDCSSSKQLLVCGDDGNNYLSPCYAGCKGVSGTIFTECLRLQNSSSGSHVTPGVCSPDCHSNFLLYAALHGVQYLVEAGTMIPRWLLLLRVVEPQDRGFASSFYIFFYSIMSIPSPNVFGKLIDDACIIWDGNVCTLYDRDAIRYLMSGLDVGVNVLSILTNIPILAILLWERRKSQISRSVPDLKQSNLDSSVRNDESMTEMNDHVVS
ncbi:solute carrier organic anion transporter family member 3A1-like [Physella acuta]|uniref:solute carrier organic anion transporter family member 3A1-like n=1 Tax=Physella acuta TaxID=109671 RepID=UPI0027DE1920|nr:solute carrier organic anion transporter family member 3A1-like [Physella acuta]